jgi:hypothetical protein
MLRLVESTLPKLRYIDRVRFIRQIVWMTLIKVVVNSKAEISQQIAD